MSDFPTQLLINGQWIDGSGAKRLVIVNPATEESFAEVSSATADEIGQAAEAGQAAFESGWRDMPPGERTRLLRNLAKRIHENVETLAQLETRNVGKPIGDARWEADAGAVLVARLSQWPRCQYAHPWPRLFAVGLCPIRLRPIRLFSTRLFST